MTPVAFTHQIGDFTTLPWVFGKPRFRVDVSALTLTAVIPRLFLCFLALKPSFKVIFLILRPFNRSRDDLTRLPRETLPNPK
jgi:hypothetical protein